MSSKRRSPPLASMLAVRPQHGKGFVDPSQCRAACLDMASQQIALEVFEALHHCAPCNVYTMISKSPKAGNAGQCISSWWPTASPCMCSVTMWRGTKWAVFVSSLASIRCVFATGELRLHATIPFVISTFALASLAYHIDTSPPLAFLSLLAATSIWGSNGILYSYPAAFLQGPAAATGIALINTIGSLGGVIGPMLLGEHQIPHILLPETFRHILWLCLIPTRMSLSNVWCQLSEGKAREAWRCKSLRWCSRLSIICMVASFHLVCFM